MPGAALTLTTVFDKPFSSAGVHGAHVELLPGMQPATSCCAGASRGAHSAQSSTAAMRLFSSRRWPDVFGPRTLGALRQIENDTHASERHEALLYAVYMEEHVLVICLDEAEASFRNVFGNNSRLHFPIPFKKKAAAEFQTFATLGEPRLLHCDRLCRARRPLPIDVSRSTSLL